MFVHIYVCVEKHFANIISRFMWATWLSTGNLNKLEIQKEGLPGGSVGKESACSARDLGSIPG